MARPPTPHEQIRTLSLRALHRPGVDLVDRLLQQKPGSVVIDIGAHIGGWLSHWFEMGASEVHAFEPVPMVFAQMRARWADEPRAVLNQLAVSDAPKRYTGMHVLNAHTLGDPAEVKLPAALEDTGPFDFEAVTLDAYIRDRRLSAVDFIKLDVDGFEPAALRGMAATLREFQPPIMIELSYLPRALGESCESMVNGIYECGYRLCTMAGDVCEDPLLVLEAFPWRTSFDMVAVPARRVQGDWPRLE